MEKAVSYRLGMNSHAVGILRILSCQFRSKTLSLFRGNCGFSTDHNWDGKEKGGNDSMGKKMAR